MMSIEPKDSDVLNYVLLNTFDNMYKNMLYNGFNAEYIEEYILKKYYYRKSLTKNFRGCRPSKAYLNIIRASKRLIIIDRYMKELVEE